MRTPMPTWRPAAARVLSRAVLAGVLLGATGGCSLFGGDDDTSGTSVFDVRPGQCFTAPDQVQAQISDLSRISCTSPHDQEAYAVLPYRTPDGTAATDFPGDDALTTFAEGACASAFGTYVGVSYLDSSLFFTYLLPSPRSWEDDDRNVICFVINSGASLNKSVKDSRR